MSTGAVAERLGVTPASASAMLRRLADEGLVEHTPYHGVRLTKRGQEVALEVIRHHRLIETYLSEVLGMPWDRVHDEAEVLEHYISEELEELIAAKLGDPSHDPHGDPIPDQRPLGAEGRPDRHRWPRSRRGRPRPSPASPTATRRCFATSRTAGILPGAKLEVTGRQPFGGPLLVEVDGTSTRSETSWCGGCGLRLTAARLRVVALADEFQQIRRRASARLDRPRARPADSRRRPLRRGRGHR